MALQKWFIEARSHSIAINGPILLEKAPYEVFFSSRILIKAHKAYKPTFHILAISILPNVDLPEVYTLKMSS